MAIMNAIVPQAGESQKISQENPKKTLVFVIFCNQWDFPFKVETPNVDVGIPQYYQWDFPMLLVGFSNLTSGFPSVVSGIFQFGFGIFQFDIGIFQSLWWDFQFSFGIFQFEIGIFQCFWWDFPNLHWNSPNMGYPIELGIPQVTWNIPCCNGISHVARILRRPTFSLGFPKIILAVYSYHGVSQVPSLKVVIGYIIIFCSVFMK